MRLILTLILMLAFTFNTAVTAQRPNEGQKIPFETIDRGSVSHYRYSDPGFVGGDFVIREQRAWQWFWSLHNSGVFPPSPPPAVDFGQETVLVAMLGYQSTGGPSISITAITYDPGCNCYQVVVERDETPGMIQMISNPYHIVKARLVGNRSVLFHHHPATFANQEEPIE